MDNGTGAIMNPGCNLAHQERFMGETQHFPRHKLSHIITSPPDPDIIVSPNRWLRSALAMLEPQHGALTIGQQAANEFFIQPLPIMHLLLLIQEQAITATASQRRDGHPPHACAVPSAATRASPAAPR